MMSEWVNVKLGDVCNIKYGKDHKKLNDGNIPVYGSGGIMRYVDTMIHDKKSVLIPRKGTLENLFLANPPFWTVDTIFWTDIDNNLINTDFLYFLLFTKNLAELNVGTAVPSLTTAVLNEIELQIPPLDTQKQIAKILSSIDDKIELNNKINDNLEKQAQAIFKSWFVDFEPFGGVMPGDWVSKTLDEVCTMVAGGDKPAIVSDIPTEVCSFPIYSNGIDNEGLYGFTDNAKIFKESVTVSARGTIGFTCLRLTPYVPIVRLISLTPNQKFITAKYLYLWLLNQHISGTGTTQQQLTVPNFKSHNILIPAFEEVERFTVIANAIFGQIHHNKNQNQKLAELRDTLLHRLMSGEIDVSNLEA